MMKDTKSKKMQTLSEWVIAGSLVGQYVFTLESVENEFPQMSVENRRVSLSRLVRRGEIVSPWRGFYVTVPTEYKLKGEVPPVFWMDSLMKHLGRDYYVSLLSAAEFYGAAHQRPMTFSVMVQGTALRSGVKNGYELVFMRKESLPMDFVRTFPTQMGTLNVSSPELTALDLVDCQEKVGGLNRVSTVLSELVEQMDWEHIDSKLLSRYSAPVVQRLGYILEKILEETNQADTLLRKAKDSGIVMRPVPLKLGMECKNCDADRRWQILKNMKIEIDEI